jgi:hypothetical protein
MMKWRRNNLAAKNVVPKGYHMMPSGKLMKDSEMKKNKMSKVMKEYGAGKLNIGKSKKIVKNQKQAVAIGLSVSRKKI